MHRNKLHHIAQDDILCLTAEHKCAFYVKSKDLNMYRNEIVRKISDLRELGFPKYHPRSAPVPIIPYSISTVLGARRTGKSFRVLQIADELIKKKN